MNLTQSLALRDEHRPKLIGKPIDKMPAYVIKDIIVVPETTTPAQMYEKMWHSNLTNEAALVFFSASEEYEVYVLSHQWPWGSGDLLTSKLSAYLRRNPL